MENILTFILLFVIGTQFGIALASSLIVHPILAGISRKSAIEVFKPFFHKTHTSMISFSIVVTILALALSLLTKNWGKLHLVRTIWNGGIFLAFLFLAIFL